MAGQAPPCAPPCAPPPPRLPPKHAAVFAAPKHRREQARLFGFSQTKKQLSREKAEQTLCKKRSLAPAKKHRKGGDKQCRVQGKAKYKFFRGDCVWQKCALCARRRQRVGASSSPPR